MTERDPILIAKQLAEPFDPSIISWRVGSVSTEKQRGMALAYIDARDVMRRLDDVCGPENWQDDYPWSDGKRVICRIGIKIGDEWVYKADGAGDTDYEGEKGALSDGFKRAAVKWGVGRYLYDVAAPWVAVEQRGKTWVIAENELPRLRSRLPAPRPRAAQKPAQQLGDPWADAEPAPAPVQQRPAPRQQSPVSNGTGHQAASIAPPHPDWWKRDDYAIDPGVILGGIGQWDAVFLAHANAATNIDQLAKLQNDNAAYHKAWCAKVAPPVRADFLAKLTKIDNRLCGLETLAIAGERFASA